MPRFRNKEIPDETMAAIVLLCVIADELITTKDLTLDILEELQEIRPALDRFLMEN